MKSTRVSALLVIFLAFAAFAASRTLARAQGRPCAGDSGQSASSQGLRKGLDEFNRAFIDACRSMNHDAAAQLWADGGNRFVARHGTLGRQARNLALAYRIGRKNERCEGASVRCRLAGPPHS